MSDASTHDPYLVPHITEALAGDPRTAVLDVHVQIAGTRLLLTGNVSTPERRAAVSEVVEALAAGMEVHNALSVTDCPEPDDREELP